MARIVGLDLGTYSVKAAGLSTTLRGFQLSGFWEERVPAPASEEQTLVRRQAEAVRALFQKHGLHPDTIVCGVPGAQAITRLLHLPFTDRKKLEQVLPFEFGEQIPFDLDEVVFDHQVVAAREGGSDILVSAIRKDEFRALVEALKAAGVDPRVMCLDTLPFLYLAQQVLADERGPYAIVDLGHAHTSVTVLAEGGIQYVRTLTRGGLAVTQSIATELGIEMPEAEAVKLQHGGGEADGSGSPPARSDAARVQGAVDRALRPLVADLRQTLQAHAALKRGRVETIYLCGGTSRLRGVDSLLAASLGVEVRPLQPLRGPFASFAGPGVAADALPKALALGLRAISSARGPQMNLRTGEFGFRGDFQFLKGRIIQIAVGIAAILVLVAAYVSVRFHSLNAYAARQKQFLADVTRQTLGEEVTEFSVAHQRITRGGARAALGELLPQTSAFDYLVEISRNIGKEKIDVKRLDIGQKRISMEGEIDTIGALDAVVQNLSRYKCFEKQVRIMKSGKNQLNNRANFQLLITPSC